MADRGAQQQQRGGSGRGTSNPQAPAVGGLFKTAALQVLRHERRQMSSKEITKLALARGLLKAQGKTPEASMAAALYTDTTRRASTSPFTRPQEGHFGLKEWTEEEGPGAEPRDASPLQQQQQQQPGSTATSGSTATGIGRVAGDLPGIQVRSPEGPPSPGLLCRAQQPPGEPRGCGPPARLELRSAGRDKPARPGQRADRSKRLQHVGGSQPAGVQQPQQLQQPPQQQPLPLPQPAQQQSPHAGGVPPAGCSCAPASLAAGAASAAGAGTYGACCCESPMGRLLTLRNLACSSPTPFSPRTFINADGVTVAPSPRQRKRRLTLAVLEVGPGGAHQVHSPGGGIMAALVAEAGSGGGPAPSVSTPWSSAHAALSTFSPGSSVLLDTNALTTPRPAAPEGPSNTLRSQLPATPRAAVPLMAAAALAGGRAAPGTAAGAGCAGRPAGAPSQAAAAAPAPAAAAAAAPLWRQASAVGSKRPHGAAFDDGACAEMCQAAQAAAMAAMGSPGSGLSDMAALEQWQQTIEAAEQEWGPSHPAVGRAWLELARALQAADKGSERAKLATKKAFDFCHVLLRQTAVESHAQQSLEYLLDRFNRHRRATAADRASAEAAADAARQEANAAADSAAAAVAAMAPSPWPLGFGHGQQACAPLQPPTLLLSGFPAAGGVMQDAVLCTAGSPCAAGLPLPSVQ